MNRKEESLIEQLEYLLDTQFEVNPPIRTPYDHVTVKDGHVTGVCIAYHNMQYSYPLAGVVELLSQFEFLEDLRLFQCHIEDGFALAALSHLKKLSLSFNKFTDIDFLSSFNQLEDLDLGINQQLRNIDALAGCKALRELNLEHTNVSVSALRELTNLEVLYLCHCPIDPEPLRGLVNLRILDLDTCDTGDVEFVKEFTHLEEVNLPDNRITDISYFSGLTQLKKLNLSYNPIGSIDCLKELHNLISLEVNDCGITDISVVENFPSIETLGIRNNPITDISVLKKLPSIKDLSISELPVDDLQVVSSLVNLEKFWGSRMKIKDLSFLKPLVNLKEVRLEVNDISDISPLADLKNLVVLWLSKNSIRDISPLQDLHLLKELLLSDNQLVNISPLRKMSHLSNLQLDGNRITDISPLNELSSLECIDLKNNRIVSLPEWVINYQIVSKDNLIRDGIGLWGNPLIDPPVEIIQQGQEAVKRYFERKKKEEFVTLREAKVILVGEGGAGKTSLKVRLLDEEAALPATEERTRGIEVTDWDVGDGYKAHLWDFGGQDIYYPVHRFFLTENSLFLLLGSTRNGQHNFEYWLPVIRQFGGKSPVMIGQTCHDGLEAGWHEVHHFVRESDLPVVRNGQSLFFHLDLPYGNSGLEVIRKEVIHQLTSLPQCCKSVSASWVTVRNQLIAIAQNEPCIPFDRFREICHQVNPQSFSRTVDIYDCAQFLHDMGNILWYSQDLFLREWIILQPNWAIEAVYSLLDSKEAKSGHISESQLKSLWQEDTYEGMFELLKQMLLVFGVAFQKKTGDKQYILPSFLPFFKGNYPVGNEYSELIYQYDLMPRNMVNQLSAMMSPDIQKDKKGNQQIWSDAVCLGFGGKKCFVYEDPAKRQLIIRYSDRDVSILLTRIMDRLETIHQQYKGISTHIWVNCTCAKCCRSQWRTRFDYGQLLRLQEEGRVYVTCNESDTRLRINDLLYRSGLRKEQEREVTKKCIRVFLASPFELKSERDALADQLNLMAKDSPVWFRVERWEDLSTRMSRSRLQDEYNKIIPECDVFIALFWKNAGQFSVEEFNVAYEHFTNSDTARPAMYVWFKKVSPRQEKESLTKFKKKIRRLKHFPFEFKNKEDLVVQVTNELNRQYAYKEDAGS